MLKGHDACQNAHLDEQIEAQMSQFTNHINSVDKFTNNFQLIY